MIQEKIFGETQDCGLYFDTEKIHTKISLSHFILPLLLGHREEITYLENPIYFAVCFFLGNSPASEFYMPTFRNTLFHLQRRIGVTSCL
jgi:hypothetical protein